MKTKLINALFNKCNDLISNEVTSIKEYEVAFQGVIEEMFPNKAWWEVTECEIFMHLFEHRNPGATVIAIVAGLKEE